MAKFRRIFLSLSELERYPHEYCSWIGRPHYINYTSWNNREEEFSFSSDVLVAVIVFVIAAAFSGLFETPPPCTNVLACVCYKVETAYDYRFSVSEAQPVGAGGGELESYMKGTGMLVVSLRGVNCGFLYPFGCRQHFKPSRSQFRVARIEIIKNPAVLLC